MCFQKDLFMIICVVNCSKANAKVKLRKPEVERLNYYNCVQ